MDGTIALFLLQDAVINGTIYALVAIALLLIFAVTRVILVPQGEFIAFAVLTLAALETNRVPPTVWFLVALGGMTVVSVLLREWRRMAACDYASLLLFNVALPVCLLLITQGVAPLKIGFAWQILLTLALIAPMGPMMYRIAFEPLAEASVLVLLIAAFGVHFAFMGMGLVFYGPEGVRTTALISQNFSFGNLVVSGQSLAVIAVTIILLAVFAWFSQATLLGKALRACSANRLGARLVGIRPSLAGQTAFAVAALIGAVSGILVGPLTTIYYDSGFLLGLKGFVAAIVAGLVSYPAAALAAIAVGLVESFSSFWASLYKEVLVFAILVPVLVWRSIYAPHPEEEE